MSNKWKSPYSRLIKGLRNSRSLKIKNRWSRNIGAGFIAEDIQAIQSIKTGLRFTFSWGSQTIPIGELNLRETEEALKWALRRQKKHNQTLDSITG